MEPPARAPSRECFHGKVYLVEAKSLARTQLLMMLTRNVNVRYVCVGIVKHLGMAVRENEPIKIFMEEPDCDVVQVSDGFTYSTEIESK